MDVSDEHHSIRSNDVIFSSVVDDRTNYTQVRIIENQLKFDRFVCVSLNISSRFRLERQLHVESHEI